MTTNRTADVVLMSTTVLKPTAFSFGISSTASYMKMTVMNQSVYKSCNDKNTTSGKKALSWCYFANIVKRSPSIACLVQ
jgi:hypothetical protein